MGDYEAFARTADPRTAYEPLYTIDSPLHSIDWGTQFARTSRNPDGDNGPRDNGAEFSGTLSLKSQRLDALTTLWRKPAEGNPLFGMPGSIEAKVDLVAMATHGRSGPTQTSRSWAPA